MKRRLFNAGALVSLLLGVSLWILTNIKSHAVVYGEPGREVWWCLVKGRLEWSEMRWFSKAFPQRQGWRWEVSDHKLPVIKTGPAIVPPWLVRTYRYGESWLVPFGLLPCAWLLRRKWRDSDPTACPDCAYDLRGTPGSECPECGALKIRDSSR